MKCLKMFFSSLLLLLVVCQFSQVQATNSIPLPVYQNVIADISLAYDQAMLAGTITLDNGLILRILDYKTRDDNVMNSWQPGDVLVFKADVKDDALLLATKRISGPDQEKVEAYLIFDVIDSPESGLMIAEINDDGKFIRLNDNSVWEFSWYNHLSTKKWSVGERVLVSGLGDKNSYEFINLDAPVTGNIASATGSFVVY